MHKINWLFPAKWRSCSIATILLSISLLKPALAQQAPTTIRLLPEDAQRGTLGHQHNFYFLPPGVSGEDYQNAGFFGQKIRPYLAGNAEALGNLNQYRRQKTIFLIDRLVAVGAFGWYGQQIFAHGEREYFNSNQQVATGLFAASIVATLFINQNTNTHFQRAVAAYNAGPARGQLWQRLRPTGVGLASTSTGAPLLALRWNLR